MAVTAGTYRFGDPSLSYRSDPSRRIYGRLNYSPQTFFDGTRTDYGWTIGVRATNQFAAETRFSRSDVDRDSKTASSLA